MPCRHFLSVAIFAVLGVLTLTGAQTEKMEEERDRQTSSPKETDSPDKSLPEKTKEVVPVLEGLEAIALVQKANGDIPSLIQLLKNQDDAVRIAAASDLVRVGIKLRDDFVIKNWSIRKTADYQSPVEVVPVLKEAVPILIEMTKDQNEFVRAAGGGALGKIAATAKEIVPILVNLLKDQNSFSVRSSAAGALGDIGCIDSKTKEVVLILMECLKSSQEVYVRSAAAGSLGIIGLRARESIPVLIGMTKDQNKDIRIAAIYALWNMGSESRVVPALIELLKDQDADVRIAAVYTLMWMGSDARIVPALIEPLTKDQNADVRIAIAYAMGRIGSTNKKRVREIVPYLIRCLTDQNKDVRDAATFSLEQIDPAALKKTPKKTN